MGHDVDVAGAIVLAVVIVVVLPVAFMMSGGAVAALLGWSLWNYAEVTHEGSELVETNT